MIEKCVMGWRLISKAWEYTIDYVWHFFTIDNSTIINQNNKKEVCTISLDDLFEESSVLLRVFLLRVSSTPK